jgi:hypothetical protein
MPGSQHRWVPLQPLPVGHTPPEQVVNRQPTQSSQKLPSVLREQLRDSMVLLVPQLPLEQV